MEWWPEVRTCVGRKGQTWWRDDLVRYWEPEQDEEGNCIGEHLRLEGLEPTLGDEGVLAERQPGSRHKSPKTMRKTSICR